MNMKVDQFVKGCKDCQLFIDKKTTEPIQPHSVPSRCWEKVAVDLFGPMPSSNHVVVVHDLTSRFPAAKVVSSSKASKFIPALEQIYDAYGNLGKQLSDNGPPFNSKEMGTFAKERNITLEKTPPMHLSANLTETFMKSVGKTMKIAAYNHVPEKKALSHLLSNYRDTPHPSTCIAPAAMMFRVSHQITFPRMPVSEEAVNFAREQNLNTKHRRKDQCI